MHTAYRYGSLFILSMCLLTGQGVGVSSSETVGSGRLDDEQAPRASSPAAFENVCPEGWFLNPTSGDCQRLDKPEFGFDMAVFLEAVPINRVYTLPESPCPTRQDVQQALLSQSEAGGGVVQLPACRIQGPDEIRVPPNVVVQGAGMGQTILEAASGNVQVTGLHVYRHKTDGRPVSNVILRDLTVDATAHGYAGKYPLSISLFHVNNVLVERVEVFGQGSGIVFASAQHITLRYNKSQYNVGAASHGIGSKDCSSYDAANNDRDGDGWVSKPEACGGAGKEPLFWTHNVAIYSNLSAHNGGDGLDLHAAYAEVAGNTIRQNEGSSKFPEPAQFVWIHDNIISANASFERAVKFDLQYPEADATLAPSHIAFYRNRVTDNLGLALRVNRAVNIYLLDNIYINNLSAAGWGEYPPGLSVLRVSEGATPLPSVYVCEDTDDARLTVAYRGPQVVFPMPATDWQCDLRNVAHIFEPTSTSGGPSLETDVEGVDAFPRAFGLGSSYPDPFYNVTMIPYALPQQSRVRIDVFDVKGRLVRRLVDAQQAAGWHTVSFDASAFPNGVYLYRMEAPQFNQTRQMHLIK